MMTTLEDLTKRFDGFELMMQQSLDKLSGLEAWWTTIEVSMGSLFQKTDTAATRQQQLESAPPPPPPHPASPSPRRPATPQNPTHGVVTTFDLNHAPQASMRSSASPSERAYGHCEQGGGILGPRTSNFIQGMTHDPHPPLPDTTCGLKDVANRKSPLPKIEFPKFDGDNPRLWRDRCEMYFDVYAVSAAMKTRFAALNFVGAAALWLQSVERRGRITDWEKFYQLGFQKYDRDQYKNQLRQLDSLQQTGTVAEYQAKFEQLSHGILQYNESYDDTYFVTRFVGGLKEEIRAAIALHRPPDVDSASALALLQEQEIENARSKIPGKGDANYKPWKVEGKTYQKRLDTPTGPKQGGDKLESLKEFRRANGLCYRCGEKWNHNHKCPPQVPLHVLEELWDTMDQVFYSTDLDEVTPQPTEVVLAVNVDSPPSSRIMKFLAQIGKTQILVLVDSRSVGTFVSQALIAKLKLPTLTCNQVQDKAADGGPMTCAQYIPELHWYTQKQSFCSQAKCYPYNVLT